MPGILRMSPFKGKFTVHTLEILSTSVQIS